jgi:hypothetical protein
MQVIYVDGEQARELAGPSIFLAGPTPRSIEDGSWRPEALEIFKARQFDGTVFVPERRDWIAEVDYFDQVEWEWLNLHRCGAIMFWVPRVLPAFPAFTTNVEFGFYLATRTGAVIYGRPDWGQKNKYLDWLFKKVTSAAPKTTLIETVKAAIERASTPAGV